MGLFNRNKNNKKDTNENKNHTFELIKHINQILEGNNFIRDDNKEKINSVLAKVQTGHDVFYEREIQVCLETLLDLLIVDSRKVTDNEIDKMYPIVSEYIEVITDKPDTFDGLLFNIYMRIINMYCNKKKLEDKIEKINLKFLDLKNSKVDRFKEIIINELSEENIIDLDDRIRELEKELIPIKNKFIEYQNLIAKDIETNGD